MMIMAVSNQGFNPKFSLNALRDPNDSNCSIATANAAKFTASMSIGAAKW